MVMELAGSSSHVARSRLMIAEHLCTTIGGAKPLNKPRPFLFRQFLIGAIASIALGISAQAEPLDQPVVGPKLLCFKYSAFTLRAGERVTEFSGSMEGISIKIKSSAGSYEIAESEIFASPAGGKRLVSLSGKASVYRIVGGEKGYVIYGPTSYSRGEDVPLIWLSGAAVRSIAKARQILGRFDARDPRLLKCEQTFTYGH
jgi:hypothetical protein